MVDFAAIRRVVGGRKDTFLGKFFLSVKVYFYLDENDQIFVAGHFWTEHRFQLYRGLLHPVKLGQPLTFGTYCVMDDDTVLRQQHSAGFGH